MSDKDDSSPMATSDRTMELAIAALCFAFGAVVMADSWRIGARWAEDGPQAGYFPFYIGLIVCASSAATFVSAWRRRAAAQQVFLTRHQLRQILALAVPLTVYVALIAWLGIYVASAAFIAYFMLRHGQHHRGTVVAVALGVPLAFFLMFERWFKLPLPKGPLEALLGFA